MSNDVRKQVEDPQAHVEIATARNMPDAANAGQSLQGYAAINGRGEDDEIAQLAYQYFLERERASEEGSADGDWFRAEQEVSRARNR